MPRSEDEDEETGSNASDSPELPLTCAERFDRGVELCARHAPGWVAAAILLLWVGDGWWRDRLLARVRAMGLEERVIAPGLVAQERVPAMMRAMDVLCHPSSREGLPRTVPQALLAGVCPVAYDIDGTREACREMETGRLVPHGDVGALREALRWARDNPRERLGLAATGRAWCATEFDHGAMVDHLESVYAEAMKRAGR